MYTVTLRLFPFFRFTYYIKVINTNAQIQDIVFRKKNIHVCVLWNCEENKCHKVNAAI